jgi:diguanylate cyclase (GGDEF)-like protein
MSDQMPAAGLPLVLLVGDPEGATRWLWSLLESGGYGVLSERSGRHALERAGTQPDAIIVDAGLRDMEGVEVCRALRQDPRITGSTAILLSIPGHADREQRLVALRAGASECLAPPHDADEILLKVNAYVRAKLDADRARAEGLVDPVTGLYSRHGLARRARELGSHAFRDHAALACVALALDVEPEEPGGAVGEGAAAVVRSVQALKSRARLSDVVGRLGPSEFAVLAPSTDAAGARQLAERLAGIIEASATPPPGEAAQAGPAVRVRCGYEAVANMAYAPIEPVELLVRASAAVRTGKAEPGGQIRRFDAGLGYEPPSP